jgi:hypothetical protein
MTSKSPSLDVVIQECIDAVKTTALTYVDIIQKMQKDLDESSKCQATCRTRQDLRDIEVDVETVEQICVVIRHHTANMQSDLVVHAERITQVEKDLHVQAKKTHRRIDKQSGAVEAKLLALQTQAAQSDANAAQLSQRLADQEMRNNVLAKKIDMMCADVRKMRAAEHRAAEQRASELRVATHRAATQKAIEQKAEEAQRAAELLQKESEFSLYSMW